MCRQPPSCVAREAWPSGGSAQAVRAHHWAVAAPCSPQTSPLPPCPPRTPPPLGGHRSVLSCFGQTSPGIATTHSQARSPARLRTWKSKKPAALCLPSPRLTRSPTHEDATDPVAGMKYHSPGGSAGRAPVWHERTPRAHAHTPAECCYPRITVASTRHAGVARTPQQRTASVDKGTGRKGATQQSPASAASGRGLSTDPPSPGLRNKTKTSRSPEACVLINDKYN